MTHALRWGITVALLAACGTKSGNQAGSAAGSAAQPPAATTSAPATPRAPVDDPWKVERPAVEPSIAELACPTIKAPYYYRIEKAGKVSHLLGTRHLGVAFTKLPAQVVDELHGARVVVMETAPDDDSGGKPTGDTPLPELLGPELWERYKRYMGNDLAESMRGEHPAVASLMLMAKYEDKLASLDRDVEATALRDGKVVLGLETGAFQAEMIERLLDARSMRAYLKALDSLDELRADTIDDVKEYCEGTDDAPGMDPKERADMLAGGYTEAELAAFEKEMLFDRNRRWIPKLVPMLNVGNVFIAVGADHTRGDQGVPALLRAQGFTVTRVTRPTPPEPSPAP